MFAHSDGDVVVDCVHAGHCVASAVHLENLRNVGGVEPSGVGVTVVVGMELAGVVRPGGLGEVGGSDFLVSFDDRNAGPGFGEDVDGPAGAVASGVEAFGGGGDVAVGVVGTAGMAAFGAEE